MITVAPITPELAESYKAVRLRALRDSPSAFGSTYAKESPLTDEQWRQRAARLDGEQAVGFLACDSRGPCGIVACFVDHQDPATARLVSMWVAPAHRRRGVGQMLVNAVIDWARSRRLETLSLMVTSNNDAAMRFYQWLGFVKTGRTEPYPNDPAMMEFEMSRALEPAPS